MELGRVGSWGKCHLVWVWVQMGNPWSRGQPPSPKGMCWVWYRDQDTGSGMLCCHLHCAAMGKTLDLSGLQFMLL